MQSEFAITARSVESQIRHKICRFYDELSGLPSCYRGEQEEQASVRESRCGAGRCRSSREKEKWYADFWSSEHFLFAPKNLNTCSTEASTEATAALGELSLAFPCSRRLIVSLVLLSLGYRWAKRGAALVVYTVSSLPFPLWSFAEEKETILFSVLED